MIYYANNQSTLQTTLLLGTLVLLKLIITPYALMPSGYICALYKKCYAGRLLEKVFNIKRDEKKTHKIGIY